MKMNSTQLLGRLTKDPELKYGASGTAYCKFTLAVNRAFKKDETDFISCTAFGKAAETIAEYVRKGDQFAVTGRIQVDVYESNGEKNIPQVLWWTDSRSSVKQKQTEHQMQELLNHKMRRNQKQEKHLR